MDAGNQIARCKCCLDSLRALVRIHQNIDAPTRKIESEEPDWILRLRKVCLHSTAICESTIDIDSMHAMATEIRAAYVQIDAVWKCMPDEFRLDEMDDDWWASESRSGILATIDHPTSISLFCSARLGGFGLGDIQGTYRQLTHWLARLGLGYGFALRYLADFLGAEGDSAARVAEALGMVSAQKDR